MTGPIRIAVSGARGRMGRRVVALAAQDPAFRVVACLVQPGGPDVGTVVPEVGLTCTEALDRDADVLLDFSLADAAPARIAEAAARGAAVLCGTTGGGAAVDVAASEASARVPVMVAPNTSTGVAVLTALVARAARGLGPGWDVEIVETHHRGKEDAPSGTALALARAAAGGAAAAMTGSSFSASTAVGAPLVHGRSGRTGPRPAGVIGMHAVRAGDVVGEHTVIFAGQGERLEIVHRAHTRDTFAAGALRAAAWLAGRPPGRYAMADVLGLTS